ncbi:MAG: YebC/PmpR family DNA-binding transcriptional regulator [Gaiellaceae bacterium]
MHVRLLSLGIPSEDADERDGLCQRPRPAILPKTTVELMDESAARTVIRLVEALEELDDVQEVFANFDIPEQLLEAVAS